MKRIFQTYLHKLAIYLAKKKSIPENISLEERILRVVFHPMNIKKTGNLIKPNSFKSPAGMDEISVNRLNYTTANFCKRHAKKIQNPLKDRTYYGFAILTVEEIRSKGAFVVFSPKLLKYLNLTHSDIKTGYVKTTANEVGVESPSEITFIADELAKTARLYIDTNIKEVNWIGPQLL